jgi:3-oxoadipate enol-lactonase
VPAGRRENEFAGRGAGATMPGMELVIPVTGGEIWAEDSGADGIPLVLMHPGWGDAAIWDPLIARLAGQYRLIRYDARGYGRSPAPAAPFSQFGDLTAVLDHLGVHRAALVAHSGSGGPAACLAVRQPDRVSALILVAPGVEDYPWPQDDPYVAEFGELFAAGDREGLVALGLRTWAAAGADPAAQAQIRSAVRAFFVVGDLMRPDPPVYGRLGEITAPTVLAIGDLDYPMVRDCGERIAASIPGCEVIVVPEADHLLPLRAPDALAGIVSAHAR